MFDRKTSAQLLVNLDRMMTSTAHHKPKTVNGFTYCTHCGIDTTLPQIAQRCSVKQP